MEMRRILYIITISILTILYSNRCIDKTPYPGFFWVEYISPEFSTEFNKVEEELYIRPRAHDTVICFRLLLEKNKDYEYENKGKKLEEYQVYDDGRYIDLLDIVQDIEITILGKKTNIKITTDTIIEENRGLYSNVINKGDYKQLNLAYLKLSDMKIKIKIKAPHIYLKDWTVFFVMGKGASGSEPYW